MLRYYLGAGRSGTIASVNDGTLTMSQPVSYRSTGTAPWNTLGLPFYPAVQGELERLPREPVELGIDLLATGVILDAGHRIRLTIVGADANNHALYPDRKGKSAPPITVHRSAALASQLELPVLKKGSCRRRGPSSGLPRY